MENLDDLKNKIEKYAESKSIEILKCEPADERLVNFKVSGDNGDGWEFFMDFISTKKEAFIILNERKLEGNSGDESEEVSIEEANINKLVNDNKGEIASLSILWIYQGKVFSKSFNADWFTEIIGLDEKLAEKEEDTEKRHCSSCNKELRKFELESSEEDDSVICISCKQKVEEAEREKLQEEIDEVAEKLSKDAEYGKFKRNVQRIYIEKKYPSIPRSKIAYIVDRAKGLMELSKKGL